jgi:isoleucyl-tRNA synthetase
MRLYMLSSPVVRAESLAFSEKEVAELSRKIFGRLGNVYEFYALYKQTAHEPSTTSTNVLDRWILTRLAQVQGEVTDALERYTLDEAARPFNLFIDDISTWYLRRSRERIKGDDAVDAQAALATTAYVLQETAKLLAPFAPFFAEWLWQELKREGDAESVHLTAWSEPRALVAEDHQVLADMQEVRNIVSLGLEQRAKAGIPVRQPLARLAVVSGGELFAEPLIELIRDEVNVKDVVRVAGLSEGWAVEIDTELTPELREEGIVREVIRAIQQARKDKGLAPRETTTATVSSNDQVLLDAIEKGKTSIMAAASLGSLATKKGETGLIVSLD